MQFLGIDLAGSEKRNTGICVLEGNLAKTEILKSDSEILEKVEKCEAKIVAIDAPLFLPSDRRNIEDVSGSHLRKCDKELLRMHIKFFPITLGPMRALTKRGIRIKKKIEKLGKTVLETYPGAVYDLFGIKREDKEKSKLWRLLGIKIVGGKTKDELDAIACAYVAKMYHEKKVIKIGEKEEGYMYLPDVKNIKRFK
ncbi:MAG: DUF429 domain-containing protein [archaeon]